VKIPSYSKRESTKSEARRIISSGYSTKRAKTFAFYRLLKMLYYRSLESAENIDQHPPFGLYVQYFDFDHMTDIPAEIRSKTRKKYPYIPGKMKKGFSYCQW
jgi:hypothetical protein